MSLQLARQFNFNELEELEVLVRKLPATHYVQPFSKNCSPVGSHIRHIIEFYQSFLLGLELGTVNYDERPRDPELEASPGKALEQLAVIKRQLCLLDNDSRPLSLTACSGSETSITTISNTERELLFLQSHTSHHKAIISLLLEQTDIRLPEEFGYALSTRVYLQDSNPPAG